MVKNLPTNAGDEGDMGLIILGQKIPWRIKWQPTPVLLPGKSHEQRRLVGYSLWSHRVILMAKNVYVHTNIYTQTHIYEYI